MKDYSAVQEFIVKGLSLYRQSYQTRNLVMKSSQLSQLTKSILESRAYQKQHPFNKAQSPLLHKPCSKDLRISYLEQYELNGHRSPYDPQLDRSRTKDALKDITEKYGFVWDSNGKLKKRDDSISSFMRSKMMQESSWRHERSPMMNRSPIINRSPINRSPHMSRSPKMNRQIYEEKDRRCVQRQRVELTDRQQYKYSKELMRKEIQQIEPSALQQSEIDNKINQIWKKYKTYESSEHYSFRPNSLNKQNYEEPTLNIPPKYSIQHAKNTDPLTTTSSHQSLISKPLLYTVPQSAPPPVPENSNNKNKFSGNFTEKTPETTPRRSFMERLQIAERSRTPENRPEIKQKKYDDKINEITSKIKKCQAQKQKMRIDYKKFDIESISRSKSKSPFSKKMEYCSHSPVKIMKQEAIDKKVSSKIQKQEIIRQNYSRTPVVERRLPTQKESPTFETTHEYNNLSKSFSFEAGTKKQQHKDRLEKQFQEQIDSNERIFTRKSQEIYKYEKTDYEERETFEMEKMNQCQNKQPLKTEVEEENRQSFSLQQSQEPSLEYTDEQTTVKKQKVSTTKKHSLLIDKFIKQIEIDEEFRNSRAWFYNNDDPHKWGILADQLVSKHDLKYNYHELVEKFDSLVEQRNPFFSTRDCQQNYSSLISSYIKSEQHWKCHFVNKFNEESLQDADFTTKQLDVENKGKLRVQDFVRYLNMKTNCFFRNRDLVLIFARLAGRNKSQIPFSKVLRILTL